MGLPNTINTGFIADEPKLWAADLPIEEILLSDLSNNFDICYLESIGTNDRNISPRMLIASFEQEIPHATSVTKADLNYPIHIYYFNDQRIILDGVHRYVKAIMQGNHMIQACKVPKSLIPLIKRSDEAYKQWKGE